MLLMHAGAAPPLSLRSANRVQAGRRRARPKLDRVAALPCDGTHTRAVQAMQGEGCGAVARSGSTVLGERAGMSRNGGEVNGQSSGRGADDRGQLVLLTPAISAWSFRRAHVTDLKSKMMLDPGLLHDPVCCMTRPDLAVDNEAPLCDWTEPDLVIAFAVSNEVAAVLK